MSERQCFRVRVRVEVKERQAGRKQDEKVVEEGRKDERKYVPVWMCGRGCGYGCGCAVRIKFAFIEIQA